MHGRQEHRPQEHLPTYRRRRIDLALTARRRRCRSVDFNRFPRGEAKSRFLMRFQSNARIMTGAYPLNSPRSPKISESGEIDMTSLLRIHFFFESGERGRAFPLACALVVLLCAPGALAIAPDVGIQVYLEDFEAEFAFPTSPEIDELSLGPMGGNGRDIFTNSTVPTLTGTSALLELEPNLTLFKGVGGGPGHLGTESISLRARYENWEVSPFSSVKNTIALAARAFDESGPSTLLHSLAIGLEWDAIAQQLLLRLVESRFDYGTNQTISNENDIVLGTQAPVLGAPFIFDLHIDRAAQHVSGHLEIVGAGSTPIGPLAITMLGSLPLEIVESQFVNDAPPTFAPSNRIEIAEIEAYLPYSSDFVVTTELDTVDTLPGNGFCADSTGACSLRAAVQESNATPGAGRITLPAPSNPFVLTLSGADEDASATGDLDLLDALRIEGQGSAISIIDGNAADRIFHVPPSAENTIVSLSDLTLRNGFAATATSTAGGAIDSWGRMRIDRCVVENNVAGYGGGIFNRRWMRIGDCVIQENQAISLPSPGGGRAGGISGGTIGALGNETETEIVNTAVVNNHAPVLGGGEFVGVTRIFASNSTFSGNDHWQLGLTNSNGEFNHMTIASDAGIGFNVASFGLPVTIKIENSAMNGSPGCQLTTNSAVAYEYAGNNASNDLSCGFVAPGSLENQPLGLAPLGPLNGTLAHRPLPSSVLRDAAEQSACLANRDQAGSPRPQDSDGDTVAICDLGAIEAPEPRGWVMLAVGVLALGSLPRFGSLPGHASYRDRRRWFCGTASGARTRRC